MKRTWRRRWPNVVLPGQTSFCPAFRAWGEGRLSFDSVPVLYLFLSVSLRLFLLSPMRFHQEAWWRLLTHTASPIRQACFRPLRQKEHILQYKFCITVCLKRLLAVDCTLCLKNVNHHVFVTTLSNTRRFSKICHIQYQTFNKSVMYHPCMHLHVQRVAPSILWHINVN